jgi:hypothetical protein
MQGVKPSRAQHARPAVLKEERMSATKRLFALSGLTAMLGALAFAIPANAAVKAQCAINGNIKADQTKPTPRKGMQLLGGSGTFTFNGTSIVCTDLASTKAPGTVHTGMWIASGTYKNRFVDPITGTPIDTTCGVGKAMGVITGQSLNAKFAPIVGAKFAIELGPVIGQGSFFWHNQGPSALKNLEPAVVKTQPDPTGAGKTNPAGPKNYRYAGGLALGLRDPITKGFFEDLGKDFFPSNKCTKGFSVVGSILVDEA